MVIGLSVFICKHISDRSIHVDEDKFVSRDTFVEFRAALENQHKQVHKKISFICSKLAVILKGIK